MRLSTINKGRATESCAMLAIAKHVELFEIPRLGARFLGGGKMVKQRVAVDVVGTIKVIQRGITFCTDVKKTEDDRLYINRCFHKKEHQRVELARMGAAGAVSGILIEACAVKRWFWLPWQRIGAVSMDWTDSLLIDLGPTTHLPDLEKVLAAPATAKEQG